MLAVWRKARLYDPTSASAATWIFTIARNLRIDAIRRDRRGGAIRVDDVEAEFEIDESPGADVRIMNEEAEERLLEALKALPPNQLKVIRMSFFEEKPHGEIANALQIPLGTVKSRMRLAMKRLRGNLRSVQHSPHGRNVCGGRFHLEGAHLGPLGSRERELIGAGFEIRREFQLRGDITLGRARAGFHLQPVAFARNLGQLLELDAARTQRLVEPAVDSARRAGVPSARTGGAPGRGPSCAAAPKA